MLYDHSYDSQPKLRKGRLRKLAKILDAAKPVEKPTTVHYAEGYEEQDQLAEAIMHPEKARFSMRVVLGIANCGTAACIEGYYRLFRGPEDNYDFREYYGLALDQYDELCMPENYDRPWLFNPTPQEAAKVIRHLVKTGEVDWSIIERS